MNLSTLINKSSAPEEVKIEARKYGQIIQQHAPCEPTFLAKPFDYEDSGFYILITFEQGAGTLSFALTQFATGRISMELTAQFYQADPHFYFERKYKNGLTESDFVSAFDCFKGLAANPQTAEEHLEGKE